MQENQIVLNFSAPKKRGLTKFVTQFFTFGVADSLVGSTLLAIIIPIGALAEAVKTKNLSGALVPVAFGVALGGLAYYQFKLLKKGTSPTKKLMNMQVLKFDPKINGYRACTPVEFATRQVAATVYFPVAFAFFTGPAMFLGALSGGFTNAMNNATSAPKTRLQQEIDAAEEKAATAAGAAVGIAFSAKMFEKYPWLMVAHDYFLKTIVVDVTKEQATHFENGGTWIPEKPIQSFRAAA